MTGTHIAMRRRELNISQKDLAKTLGISPSYLSKIEHDACSAPAELLARICAELKMVVENSFNEYDELFRLETRIADIIRELENIRETIRMIRVTPVEVTEE